MAGAISPEWGQERVKRGFVRHSGGTSGIVA